ncbi:esterase-like activity of phytase-domain-containing protein [Lophiotrema nucula]|uniref:Esterase-like activity of phytase-domain-containing protein n=1 Tax=Lophiotrema nucula TaxID=690887 RepID=A0A6A5Z8Q2_9PLEO|nr:esterase-like activity of phytase-domain-containing protein [Lophiotrema nucula]
MLLHATIAFLTLARLGSANPVVRNEYNGPVVNKTTCGGKTYVYEELAGFGFLKSDARDKFGDTIGGIGSAIALDKKSWKKKGGKSESYEGIIYGLPDRGWNTQGTQNTQNRIHKFVATLDIVNGATIAKPASPNFHLEYVDTILLYGPDGKPTTGLDADVKDVAKYPGFPDLPVATYTGDGFGNAGPGGKRISIDAEGLVLGDDGTFWVSDEYGPYIYQFDRRGRMIDAIRPPDAFIPFRNGSESFNAASPPIYDPTRETIPEVPDTGRNNNQGFEGLTASPDGKWLFVLLQSATIQDGASKSSNRRNTRLLKYKLGKRDPELVAEYAVQLPIVPGGNKIAAQSEIHYISETQLLVLARDSGAGHGQSDSASKYRNADVIDISKATNVKSRTVDATGGQIASSDGGVLIAGINPAEYCPWLSYNNNDQLNRFGVHNGGAQDASLLNEKWESFGIIPVDSKFSKNGDGKEYYLISFSDNDFITQNGYINLGKQKYTDASGYNLDNQVLVFKVRLPKGVDPL